MDKKKRGRMTKKENNIVLFSITLCWAASYIFIKSLPEDLSSYAYLTLTTGIAAIIMSIVFFKRLKEIRKGTLWKGFFLALLMCGNLLAEKAGISLLPSSNASFISSLNIIFVPLLMLFFKKFPSRNNVAGIIVILVGIFCTNGFQLQGFMNLGTLYMLAACFVMGIYTIAADRFAKEEDPLLMAVVQMMFTALMGYFLWLLEEPTTFMSLTYSSRMISSIIILAFFTKAYAYIMLMYAQKYANPLNVTVIASTEPVITLALAILLPASFGSSETFHLLPFVGSLVIACGAVIAGTDFLDKKEARKQKETLVSPYSRVFQGEKAVHPAGFREWFRLEWNSKCLLRFVIFFMAFLVLGASFKVMVLIEGFTEIRPVNALPVMFGLIAGPVGALACGLGNMAADLFGTFNATSLLGFAANFIGAYLPFRLWYVFSDEKPNLKSFGNIGRYCLISTVASFVMAFIIGAGLDIIFGVRLPQIYIYVLLNNLAFSVFLGIPVFIVLNLETGLFGCCRPIGGVLSGVLPVVREGQRKKRFLGILSFVMVLGMAAVLLYMMDGSSIRDSVWIQLCSAADFLILCVLLI